MKGMRPNLPNAGDDLLLYGVRFKVQHVEPQADFCWAVEIQDVLDGCTSVLYLPTDYNTVTDEYAYGEQPVRIPLAI